MFFKTRKITLSTLALFASFIWYSAFTEPRHVLTIAMLNVGQGDATFIETPNGNQILIDGGAGTRVLSELGRSMPAYDHSIDLLIATHTDLDHLGGLVEVAKKYQIGRVLVNGRTASTTVYQAWDTVLAEKHILQDSVHAGDRVMLDRDVYLDILGPFSEDDIPESQKANDTMVVARLTYHNNHMLFMGDIEKGDEIRLVESGTALESDLLKVAHHGSEYATTRLFLEKVLPKFAVISVGAGNRYGHPTQETLERLGATRAKLFRTDLDGRIIFLSDGVTLEKK